MIPERPQAVRSELLELRDLLRYVGLEGALADWSSFERYFAELAKDDDDNVRWWWLARALTDSALSEPGAAERAFLARLEAKLDPVARARVERFGKAGVDADALVEELGPAGRRELRAWLRLRSPVGQYVTRHTRTTLKEYRRRGLLSEPVADRDVEAVPVPFGHAERELYGKLDVLIDRLLSAHAERRGAGFVLTVYRRRLTSSWAAIRSTLRRRVEREGGMDLGDVLGEEAETQGLDTGEGRTVDDHQAVPLSNENVAEIEAYLSDLELVGDSKFERLGDELDAARGSGQSVIVFTQFVDTLDSLRDRLLPAYRSHLATFTGDGGSQFREDEGWASVSKQQLVDSIRSGRVSVVLATDAASEGLNLQACSYLINYDLPWNPMRVEQRIGRVDRIGQRASVVTVRNYVVPGTVEERVYAALAGRIDDFSDLLGNLQPILGATEDAFRRIFRSPRSEREAAIEEEVRGLGEQIDELERSGIDLSVEDPMPIPETTPPLVALPELRASVYEELDLTLGRHGRPTSFDPRRASRDLENWTALGTFAHPELERKLGRLSEGFEPPRSAVVVHEHPSGVTSVVRADRTPPEPLRHLDELGDLGEPHALGEAEELAARLASEEATRRQRRREGSLRRRQTRWEAGVRDRFVELVRETVVAEMALRGGPDGVDPNAVWLELEQDALNGWSYAEAFRARLGVGLGELLPRGLVREIPDRITGELRERRREGGQALLELMRVWRERMEQ